jgi:hypothetical protein
MLGCSPINAAEIYSMIRRREFIAGLGGAMAWPLAASAQQAKMPVVWWLDVLPVPRLPEFAGWN